MRKIVQTTKPVSKYAAKQSGDTRPVTPTPTSTAARKFAKDVVREVLYGRSGSVAFHQGNPFAHALNRAMNK